MRVAYLCADPGVPVFGTKGSSVHVQEIVRAWQGSGASVKVYCTRLGSARPKDLGALEVVERRPAAASGADREKAAAGAADLLAHSITEQGCDLVYERYSLFSTGLAAVTEELRIPGVLEVNAPLIEEQQRYRQLWDVDGAEAALRSNAGRADVVACVSRPVVDWVRRYVPLAKTVLAPNGVNVSRIRPMALSSPATGILTAAFVGTLKPWHGLPGLVEAVALANKRPEPGPRWRIRIIGDGPMRTVLETLADKLQVAAEFTGAVRPEEVPELLGACDVACAPYPAAEAGREDYFSPLKIFEYMAAGMPIIASATGQTPTILAHGRTGLLVPAGDRRAFADALAILAGDPVLRLRLGQAARQEAVRRFSWERVLSTITAALPTAGRIVRS